MVQAGSNKRGVVRAQARTHNPWHLRLQKVPATIIT